MSVIRHHRDSARLWLLRLRAAVGGTSSIEVLRADGARIGARVFIGDQTYIDGGFSWLVTVEDDVTFAPRVQVIAHDAATKRSIGQTWAAPITIKARAYVGAGATVLPGVTIGEGAVVGAGSIVNRDVPPNVVVAGVPAREICSVEDLMARHAPHVEAAKQAGLWGISRAGRTGATNQARLRAALANGGRVYVD